MKRLIGVFLIAFFLIILIVECIQFNIRGAKKIVEMKNISENISNQTKIMKIELNDDYDKNGQYLRGICGKVIENKRKRDISTIFKE